ncbi:hypothetical protein [Sinomonas susongensis]|uniref:hypothetical protein n=1 Tax=Sinomonas susongensis TaxID=1324851 RepID=UPI001107D5E3|nr:hypothetical protein [Sinomonas susongensis]
MVDSFKPAGSRLIVGEQVRFLGSMPDPLLTGMRARKGDTGEVVHVLPGLFPRAVVVKLDKPRTEGFYRLVVAEELLELVFTAGLDPSDEEAAALVAEAEALARRASMAQHPSGSVHRGNSLPVTVLRAASASGPRRQPALGATGLAAVVPLGSKGPAGKGRASSAGQR